VPLRRALPLATALALLTASAAPAAEGFTRPQDLPRGVRHDAIRRASRAVAALDVGVSDCSGAFVSPDGHLVTALHCVLAALRRAGAVEARDGADGLRWLEIHASPGLRLHGVTAALPRTAVRASDPALVLAGRRIVDLDGPQPEEVARPAAGEPTPSEDYAILKFDTAAPGVPCVPLAAADPRPGAPVALVGFPGAVKRAARRTDAGSRLVSLGAVAATFAAGETPAPLPPQAIARLDAALLSPAALLSDVDSASGASGGAVLDRAGRLAGVFSSGASDEETYRGTAALAVRASFVRREARARLGAAVAAEIFRCPPR
jgi:Trypsin-like peptidase domain